jgi:hypothetical protein
VEHVNCEGASGRLCLERKSGARLVGEWTGSKPIVGASELQFSDGLYAKVTGVQGTDSQTKITLVCS